MTDLRTYFETVRGLGVLSTSHEDGRVNAAVYARPRVLDDATVTLIMRNRRSHAFLATNPHASYLFREDPGGPGPTAHAGVRLALTRIAEEENPDRQEEVRRRRGHDKSARRFLVVFRVDEVRPLVGDGEAGAA